MQWAYHFTRNRVDVTRTAFDCAPPAPQPKAYCEAHGVAVANARGHAVNTVPEHTFALILALRRNIAAFREDVIAAR